MKRIIRGLRGHPGTRTLVVFISLGFLVGLFHADHSLARAFTGAGVMAVVLVPAYLYGAWSRG